MQVLREPVSITNVNDILVRKKDMGGGKGHFHPHSILLGGDEVCSPLLLDRQDEEYQEEFGIRKKIIK